ncbi:hypothetical protein RclHR1_24580003 [Rhizophagus clarus]|uniref:BTB domain-containing protein n=1 Tax=Rhizophagus clarus TaxID=94130 RepID=A0A2Z6RBE8_9GLOM|nr:hypothetical protein RclHR1_24580003 [Rhizophagus clarus]
MIDSKLLPKLSQNLFEILDDEEYNDITIKFGNDPYKNDGTLINIKLPNILPETFQIILRYIYGRNLSLQELIPYLETFLIENKKNWIEQNFDLIYQTSFESNSFLELRKYCTNLISKETTKIFNSPNFSSIPEKLLIMLIQSHHQMREIQVWEHIIKWRLAQNPELPSDPTSFQKMISIL